VSSPRHFSWLLALRYLNPLRLHMSAITLILLVGVALGVMVMIVVLSVMAGFEREMKQRILGFTPHIQVAQMVGAYDSVVDDWRGWEQKLAEEPGVVGAYAMIDGNIIVEAYDRRIPCDFRAINTEDEKQIKALADLLDTDRYPGGRADLGYDQVAVISSLFAEEAGLVIGEKIKLYASKNLDQVFEAYQLVEEPLISEKLKEDLERIHGQIKRDWTVSDGEEVIAIDSLQEVYGQLAEFFETVPMREVEKEALGKVFVALEVANEGKDEAAGLYRMPLGSKDDALEAYEALMTMDRKEADLTTMKSIQEFVLPIEVEVVGVYKGTQHAPGPKIFIPIQTGQELTDLSEADGDLVKAIAVLVEDPYRADIPEMDILQKLGEGWGSTNWMKAYQGRFDLIKLERAMMSFALSFIMLIAGFSIGAVMYTVTTQKKQEIGVMKALGASPWQIIKVFLYQGVIVGFFGGVFGVGLGLLVIHFRKQIQIFLDYLGVNPFPPDFHGMSVIPARVIPMDIMLIFCGSLIVCSLAAENHRLF